MITTTQLAGQCLLCGSATEYAGYDRYRCISCSAIWSEEDIW